VFSFDTVKFDRADVNSLGNTVGSVRLSEIGERDRLLLFTDVVTLFIVRHPGAALGQ